jgi:signal transduction histidine kinase
MADLYPQELEKLQRKVSIEAALERVRSRAIALQYSDGLGEVMALVFEELLALGAGTDHYAIGVYDRNSGDSDWWRPTEGRDAVPVRYPVPFREDNSWCRNVYEAWMAQEPILREEGPGEFLESSGRPWHREGEQQGTSNRSSIGTSGRIRFKGWYVPFVHGMIEVEKDNLPEEERDLLRRFGKVIDLTCTRVSDLRQTEACAREELRQTSLERVRAEIASMRSSADLQRITPLVWQELTTLGVSFFRCGLFIMEDETEYCHAYLASPQGHALSVLHLPYQGGAVIKRIVEYWHKRQVYTELWDQKTLQEWMQALVDQGQVGSSREYLFDEATPVCLALHFMPFTQGMLYVGNDSFLSDQETELVQALADTFAAAYARYEDFGRMEQANQKIGAMIVELESTRAQLIQAEKMATLGELAAGIAHEIQNPLNFVNNFSEVSVEMVDELKQALQQNDNEEVDAIITDLSEGIGKIHHHSKRAESIVKGMLQHSRRSTGEKTPTSLNSLADEYLRLAYHGLRAKDKSFNADFRMELDPGLPHLQVAASDIGRVLLNIINNAFYAVSEKRRKKPEGYKPLVSVATLQQKGMVEVRIRDNGDGIPDEVRDKIFQPFFTTKPAGQGTGLGLSLSHDIVKAHDGELLVESKEGEWTEFVVRLPIS